jgi:hypothetical protein
MIEEMSTLEHEKTREILALTNSRLSENLRTSEHERAVDQNQN